jgi:FAD/FMN-containing dehydrogenase
LQEKQAIRHENTAMSYSGWGRYPTVDSLLVEPSTPDDFARLISPAPDLPGKAIPRGAGRSYGDSALAENLLSTRYLDNFCGINTSEQGVTVLHCASGLSLDEVLQTIVPKGFFLPVVPGTKAVTVGGAIASDIHGKNHHREGSFCDHVDSLQLLLASGEVITCSRSSNADLFLATCGGMGLTGLILDASLRLITLPSLDIAQRSLVAANLKDSMELMTAHDDAHYSVAWIDCLARHSAQGRSILFLGEHASADSARPRSRLSSPSAKPPQRRTLSVPFNAPAALLNRYSMGAFNATYFALKKVLPAESKVDYDAYFFPLERLRNWNRLYGSKGFLQYQLVIPCESAYAGISAVLERVAAAGKGSFLSVLKRFGKGNANLLSFPTEGYTLALDFKYEPNLFPLLDELDAIVLDHGGRLYLAKDARMSAEFFRKTYPNWERFLEIKAKVDPDGRFSSLQSRRLGLG